MNRIARRRLLERLAAKSKGGDKLKGRKSRKEIDKYLQKMKKHYGDISGALSKSTKELEALQKFVDEHKEKETLTVNEMKKIHDIIRNMDLAGADEVRIGKDEDDVAYIIDGKACTYDSDTNDIRPYKTKKKEKEEEEDTNDALDIEAELIPQEGFDINPGGTQI